MEGKMKRPWFRIAVATAFGGLIALSCAAEVVLGGTILPW
jgi:hypothetical protein